MNTPSFPQLRKDPVVERWVLIAPERAQRPADVPLAVRPELPNGCPFCAGREDLTPPEILAVRPVSSPTNRPDWRVRVVPNMFPAVRAHVDGANRRDALFEAQPAVGSHEVVIECPQHETSLAALPVEHIADLLRVWRDRMRQLKTDPRTAYVQVFKNHGPAAGATLEHAHSQVVSMPCVPSAIQAEIVAAVRHRQQNDRCLFCDLIRREQTVGERLVRDSAGFTAIAAYAGRFPFETWILPRGHSAGFQDATENELGDLADLLRWLLRRLDQVADRPAYNLLLHSVPLAGPDSADYHWHLEILPRLTGVAGFEWGTGCFINPLAPEDAAARLRGQ